MDRKECQDVCLCGRVGQGCPSRADVNFILEVATCLQRIKNGQITTLFSERLCNVGNEYE